MICSATLTTRWRIPSAAGTAATGVPSTLRTRFHRQAYQNKEECRFGRVGKPARRHIVPRSDYTPLHKTVVYSILLEGGSMMLSRLHHLCRRSRELGCFRIINNLSCALLLTPSSPPVPAPPVRIFVGPRISARTRAGTGGCRAHSAGISESAAASRSRWNRRYRRTEKNLAFKRLDSRGFQTIRTRAGA